MQDDISTELMDTPDTQEEDKPEATAERKAFVKRWHDEVTKAKKHWEKSFKRMREDQKFVAGEQWEGQTENDDRYIVNLCQRHVNQRVSALYAKNPTAVAKRKKRLDFTLWDERPESLQQAMMATQPIDPMTGMPKPIDPMAMQLLQEVQTVRSRRQMVERVGKTLEIVYKYYMDEAQPPFKVQAKGLVRRVETNGVGYIKLGYQRQMDKSPDVKAKLGDFSERLAVLERLSHEVEEGEIYDGMAELEELQQAVSVLTNEPEVIIREGLVFDFPKSTAVIPDPATQSLKGWVGCNWLAQEFLFSEDEIEEIYGVDVCDSGATPYYSNPNSNNDIYTVGKNQPADGKTAMYLVWEIYDKRTGMMLTICDGYDDFLEEPRSPRVFMERFYPIFALSFNDIEKDDELFPPSDVRLMRHQQQEYNRVREGLREHRIQNKPAYASPKGTLGDEDKDKLASHDSGELIELNVPPNTDIKTVLQPLGKIPIDPSCYETAPIFDDIQKIVGAQEADFGGTSGVAATEISVAEGARISTIQSNIDDLDDLLTELARAAGQVLLTELSAQSAKKIAGDGAVWPEMARADLVDELFLEIEAGSSGRPNRAHEIANFERLAPTLLQLPGINPMFLAKKAIELLGSDIDITDALMEGMPAIMSMNRMSQLGTGDPATDPNQQGQEGANKQGTPSNTAPTARPEYPNNAAEA